MTQESTPPPSGNGNRLGLVGTAINAAKALSLQNVLVIALLALILVPLYSFWSLLNDDELRQEFLSYTKERFIIGVPCAVIVTSQAGGGEAYNILTPYQIQAPYEFHILVRARSRLPDNEIQEICREALKHADILKGNLPNRVDKS